MTCCLCHEPQTDHPQHLRYTINDFNRQFPDDAACLEHLKEQRFPGGIAFCETCRKDRKHHRITGRPVYSCDHCGTRISPMAGTIFEKSTTSLRFTWNPDSGQYDLSALPDAKDRAHYGLE